MFKEGVNSACKHFVENYGMHPSAKRLYEAAFNLRGIQKQGDVAEFFGVSPQVLNNWERRGVSKEGRLGVFAKHSVSPQWIETGDGSMLLLDEAHKAVASPTPPLGSLGSLSVGFTATPAVIDNRHTQLPSHFLVREPSNVGPAPALREQRRIPVRGEVKGGDDGFLEELSYATSDGFVESQSSDPQAYALRVRGDSMHPRYRAGEFIVVEPGIEAQPGDDVVVALKDGRKLLKELNWIRDGELQLLSINSNFGPLTLPLSEVLHIHLAAHRVRRNAFVKGP